MIYNDFGSFETHLTGLRHLVEMRGGVDSLGWDGFIKNSITGYVEAYPFSWTGLVTGSFPSLPTFSQTVADLHQARISLGLPRKQETQHCDNRNEYQTPIPETSLSS